MKKTLSITVLAVAAALQVAAQPYGRPNQDWNRGGYGNGNGNGYGYDDRRGGDPVGGAIQTLERMQRFVRVDGHERGHFRSALGSLYEFQNDARRGRFDRGALDNAIHHVRNLAQADQLAPRDRAVLRERLDRLVALRGGGFRDGNGYGDGYRGRW